MAKLLDMMFGMLSKQRAYAGNAWEAHRERPATEYATGHNDSREIVRVNPVAQLLSSEDILLELDVPRVLPGPGGLMSGTYHIRDLGKRNHRRLRRVTIRRGESHATLILQPEPATFHSHQLERPGLLIAVELRHAHQDGLS